MAYYASRTCLPSFYSDTFFSPTGFATFLWWKWFKLCGHLLLNIITSSSFFFLFSNLKKNFRKNWSFLCLFVLPTLFSPIVFATFLLGNLVQTLHTISTHYLWSSFFPFLEFPNIFSEKMYVFYAFFVLLLMTLFSPMVFATLMLSVLVQF